MAYCGLGYLDAAFVAAIAITVFRAAQDLYLNSIDLIELPFYLTTFTSIMTLANILDAFRPGLILVAALEAACVIFSFPYAWSLYVIAGAACGDHLAVQALDISTLETGFHVASWTLGGLAFWHISAEQRRPARRGP